MKVEKKQTIIVVEDDLTLLSFWNRITEELGQDILLFSNPAEAAVILHRITIDLLVSDIVMPKQTGFELLRIACERNPACKGLLTTGYATDLSRFDLAGFRFHLLHKPYSDINAVRYLIRGLLQEEENFDEISEDSTSENRDYPAITEWKL